MIQYDKQKLSAIGNGLQAALWSETRKFLRSKISWITAAAVVFITLICALFIYILKDPEQARRLGLLATKAQMFGGTADWANFFNLILIIFGYAGTIILGFVFIWIFGREFGNRTIYDLLALPTSRSTIVLAKIMVASAWAIVLILIVSLIMLAIGTALNLPGGTSDVLRHGFGLLAVTGLCTVILSLPFALIACLTRGYLPAVGSMFIVIILSQVFDSLGYAPYFPWCVPSLLSGAAEALTGTPSASAEIASFIIVGLTGFGAAGATLLWWRFADQN